MIPAPESYFKAQQSFVNARTRMEESVRDARQNPTRGNRRRVEYRIRKMDRAWAWVQREREAYRKLRGVA